MPSDDLSPLPPSLQAQETVTLANVAREYGQEPEAEMDTVLDFNTKVGVTVVGHCWQLQPNDNPQAYLLLTPTHTTLEKAKRSRGPVASKLSLVILQH